jgi:hypothetical protein
LKIEEDKVTIVCRQEDLTLVESVVSDAVGEYKNTAKRNVTVSVDKHVFLPPGPDKATNQLETWQERKFIYFSIFYFVILCSVFGLVCLCLFICLFVCYSFCVCFSSLF